MDIMKKYKKKFDVFKVIINKDAPTILEIGAHFGEDSMRFAEAFPSAVIHCFEPDPRCIEVFKKYVKNERIKLHEIALSNTAGELEFFQSYNESEQTTPEKYDWISDEDYSSMKLGNSGSSSLKKGYGKTLSESIKVQSIRYDSWAKDNNIGMVDLAWIDVQGAERDVLDGMGDKIGNINIIWIEYGEEQYEDAMSRQDTINYMSNKGFSLIEHFSSKGDKGDLLFRRSS